MVSLFTQTAIIFALLEFAKNLDCDGHLQLGRDHGGAWFYDNKLIAVFEGKKQQDAGNAIERWFKNNYICRLINLQVSYVTFATGEGAYEGGVIGKALNVAHPYGFNKTIPGSNSCFLSIGSFTREKINAIMIETICERINTLFLNLE